jgi:hypothetical protein
MSKSSKTLKPHEVPLMQAAQLQATSLDYINWTKWMREKHTFASAVRMAVKLGFAKPGPHFYNKMRTEGFKLKRLLKKDALITPTLRVVDDET